jgi:hypothetical protein
MRDLVKTGKKEELAMFFDPNSKAVYHLDLTPIGLGLRPLATKNRLM